MEDKDIISDDSSENSTSGEDFKGFNDSEIIVDIHNNPENKMETKKVENIIVPSKVNDLKMNFKDVASYAKSFDGDKKNYVEFKKAGNFAFKMCEEASKKILLEFLLNVKLTGRASNNIENKNVESWDDLIKRFDEIYLEKKDLSSLQIKFTNIRQLSNESARDFGDRIETLKIELGNAYRERYENNNEMVEPIIEDLKNRALSHFLYGLKKDIAEEVRRAVPRNLEEAISKASDQEFLLKQLGIKTEQTTKVVVCFACQKRGHIAKDCRSKGNGPEKNQDSEKKDPEQKKKQKPKDISGVTCYNCSEKGHYANSCGKEDKRKLKENVNGQSTKSEAQASMNSSAK